MGPHGGQAEGLPGARRERTRGSSSNFRILDDSPVDGRGNANQCHRSFIQ